MNVLKVKQQGRTRAAQGSSSLGHLHIARREIRKKERKSVDKQLKGRTKKGEESKT